MTFFFKLHLFVCKTNYIPIESMKPIEYANVRLPIFFPGITIGLVGINRLVDTSNLHSSVYSINLILK